VSSLKRLFEHPLVREILAAVLFVLAAFFAA
jgi:hypothetical protein